MKLSLYVVPPFVLQNLIWVPTRLALKIFGHLKIAGRENLKGVPKGVIFALNHSSEADPIILPGSLPFMSRFSPMFYVSREKAFYKNSGWRQYFYGGAFFKAWGAYPLMPGQKDYGKSLVNHVNILKDGQSLCIFPEGKKTCTGAIGDGHGGVSYLSWATGKPIVPVAVSGAFQCRLKLFLRRKKTITVTFGRPIYPRELFSQYSEAAQAEYIDFKSATGTLMTEIKKLASVQT